MLSRSAHGLCPGREGEEENIRLIDDGRLTPAVLPPPLHYAKQGLRLDGLYIEMALTVEVLSVIAV